MGREVCLAVAAAPDLELVAAVDPAHAGDDLEALIGPGGGGIRVSGELGELQATGAQVVVDFTRIDVARSTLAYCAGEGIHVVVGTTGFSDEDLADLRVQFAGPGAGRPTASWRPTSPLVPCS